MAYTVLDPPLPTSLSVLLSGSVSALYVIAIYLAQLITFYGKPLTNSRNDPRVIRVRLLAASCATITNCYIVYRVIRYHLLDEDTAVRLSTMCNLHNNLYVHRKQNLP